ncbi:unnamed protein product [Cladocopium goreaui]|uniref:Sodium/potassium/calcium exchanger 2 n=1 Tax=Cladocopium goreaui TaxID=2562237 RepID=A0A9P1GHP5_9DINO|nr:unnamed protein product [Cladocopium goreaui]
MEFFRSVTDALTGGCCAATGQDGYEINFSVLDLKDMQVVAACKGHQEKLLEMFKKRPYLQKEEHQLAYFVKECCKAIMKGDSDEAQNGLDILEMQLDNEDKMIAAAFNKFDTDRSGKLAGSEVQFMLDYLGFPDSQDDVDKLLKVLDSDKDGHVSFDEFIHYVGKLGGSSKLFEVRRKQIQERAGFTDSAHDPEKLRILLQESGISPEAQAHWKLTASESELDSAAMMRPCQQAAIRHIRHLAQENHERALPKLQERVKKLGYTDTDLWMVLSWIRELAPIIVHINLDKVGKFFLEDSHYRNQFETNTSGGLLKTSAREKWERGLFGTAYDGANAFERPKYGVQNIWNDHRGVMGAKQYGDSYIILKDVRLRCTLSPQDSANLPARRLAVLDYYAHVLLEYSDKELKETIRVAEKGDEKVGNSEQVIEKWGMYKEAQLHGEIDLDKHVDSLVVHERHRAKHADFVKKICEKHGWKMRWMDEMRAHLHERQGGVELDMKEWQAKLKKLGRASTEALDDKMKYLADFGSLHPVPEGTEGTEGYASRSGNRQG